MFSQAQSYITDTTSKEDMGAQLGRFQGIAIGTTFMLGIPIGGILSKISPRIPLLVAVGLCLLSSFLSFFFLGESNSERLKKPFNIKEANPIGAFVMLSRTKKLFALSTVYFLLNVSQASLQIQWVNYTKYRFGWSQVQSGLSLMVIGMSFLSLL